MITYTAGHSAATFLGSGVPYPITRSRLADCVFAVLSLLASPLPAAETGSISGRVLNQTTNRYVKQARVSLKGTALQTFTDEAGAYLLSGIPAGPATIVVTFTELAPREEQVVVVAGRRTEVNLTLAPTGVVRLDEFRVNAARELDAESISANEQRYSRNLKNVTSTDSMGEIAQNNIGEFVKYLPGVGVEYQGSDIIRINVRGLSSDKTEVTSDGLSEASVFADERENTRAPRLTQSSTVGIARIEVRKVPLPSDSANAIGGSVNMVPARRSSTRAGRSTCGLRSTPTATTSRSDARAVPATSSPGRFVRVSTSASSTRSRVTSATRSESATAT